MLIREVSFHFEPTEKGEGDEWARNHETNQAWLCLAVLLIAVGCQVADTQKGGSKTMNSRNLTPKQQAMVDMWERHMVAEFEMKSIDATMATMTSRPYVNHVPVMTGGVGSDEVRNFYSTYFLQVIRPTPRLYPSLARLERTASWTI